MAISPTGTNGVTNVPNSAQGTLPGDGIQQDGSEWGATVAQEAAGDSTFNFDTYAASTAAQLESLSYSSTATMQYINAMYAGYLAAGGQATTEANGDVGASSYILAGLYSPSIAAGTLDLPGTGQEPALSNSTGSFPFTAAGAASLGAGLASSPTVDYRQWRANMEADLTSAGYSPSAVSAFLGEVDQSYYGASPSNLVNTGLNYGATLQNGSVSSASQLESYISNTVVPYLQGRGLSDDQINQYLEGMRAGYYGGNNSSIVSAGLEQGEELASEALAAGSSFNFDSYVSSASGMLASPSMNLTAAQQTAYLSAMYAGYLRGGGISTQLATRVAATAANSTPAGMTTTSNGGPTVNTMMGPSINASPWWAGPIYQAVLKAPPTPALSSDAANVISAEAGLSTAEQVYGQNPNSTTLQNMDNQWENVRTQESQFWNDLAAASSPYAASAALVAASFGSDLRFTLEGELPSNLSAGTLPSATSSAAYVFLEALAASSGLGSGVSLPSTLSQIIANPVASSSLSQSDFDNMAEGLIALYNTNPAEYYAAVQSINDPVLRSTLNYAVQDMVTNGADSLVQNGKATAAQENSALSKYYVAAESNPSLYAAWNPSSGFGTTSASGLGSLPPSTSDYGNITNYLNSPSIGSGSPPAQFAEAAAMLAQLWQTNQAAYYQVLSGIKSPALRNVLNTAVQLEVAQNPQDLNTTRATNDFNNLWNMWVNKTGPGAGSSGTWTHTDNSISAPTGSPQ